MDIATRGPVSAASLLWQRPPGWVLAVVRKVVVDVAPGDAKLRTDPSAPAERDAPWDAPYGRSLRGAMDLVPVKPRVDVVLTGHAYAPFGRPVRSLTARLAVGSLDKRIEVNVDRYFDRTGSLVEGQPFTRMPLVYERAAGGPGTWNLAGVQVGQRDGHGNAMVPNLMPPGTPMVPLDQLFIPPAGVGPLPADWPSRVEKLGRRSLRDLPSQWNGQVLPDDLAHDYFNCAPQDQQLTSLREDDTLTLENLHPSHPSLTCKLPGVRPSVSCEVMGQTAGIPLHIDTLHIDTDRGTCAIVWRGHLPLRDAREAGRLLVALDVGPPMQRKPTFTGIQAVAVAPPSPPSRSGPSPEVEAELDGTMTLAPGLAGQALPFAGPPPGAPSRPNQLGQSSASWEAMRGPSPLSQSGSWSSHEPPEAPRLAADHTLPPPVPPPHRPAPAPSLPAVTAPPMVPAPAAPPPMAKAPVTDSPWATGNSAPKRETIGMQATGGALALADPKFEPLQQAEPAPALETMRAPLHLLWFDPDSVARMRRVPRWRQLLQDLERQPLDRELDDAAAREPWDLEDRRDVGELLGRGGPSYTRGVEEALAAARARGGKLVPPLVLLEGDLEIQLDELEALKAAATTAAPLIIATDEGLRAAVDAADAFLARPGLAPAPAVCDGLHTRIREAFVREKKALPADYLDRQTERSLLVGRHYQRRKVFGGPFLRALLKPTGEKELLVYLPEDLAMKVPIYRRFAVRLIADVHLQQDQHESRPYALRALALGRSA